jgi:anti-sigma B factor antagonist
LVAGAITGNHAPADPAPDGVPGPRRPVFEARSYDGGTLTIVLSGDLDIVNRAWLAQHLAKTMKQQPRRLVIDMAEVGFADSAALRLIVRAGQLLPDGGRPVIRHPRPVVHRVLQITGLDTFCDLTWPDLG